MPNLKKTFSTPEVCGKGSKDLLDIQNNFFSNVACKRCTSVKEAIYRNCEMITCFFYFMLHQCGSCSSWGEKTILNAVSGCQKLDPTTKLCSRWPLQSLQPVFSHNGEHCCTLKTELPNCHLILKRELLIYRD